MSTFGEIQAFASYLAALRRYLGETVSPEVAMGRLRAQLDRREASFLRIVDQGIFESSRSPYVPLFAAAGIERGDVATLVREHGLEGALGRLYDAGVRVSIDELRGNRPITRGSVTIEAGPEDFDNGLARIDYQTRSGGTRSAGTPIGTDLRLLDYHAGYVPLVMNAFRAGGRRSAVWVPTAPASTGLRILLSQAKLGIRNEQWFSQSDPVPRKASPRHALFVLATVATSRVVGTPLPIPRHVPPERGVEVAEWLADVRRESGPAVLHTTPSGAVRACIAARDHSLDIEGSFFRLGSEPYTAARARAIAEAGCRAASNYYIAELGGYLGVACANAEEWDEVHLLADKIAVVQRERAVGATTVGALAFTTLHPLSPKLLINFESDDYGILSERDCGCPVGEFGFHAHLHGIRSYEKLTSEGMTFIGTDVIDLLEDTLPSRFGGSPTDYQLVEHDEDGLPAISILVSPRVGPVDEDAVVAGAIDFLRSRGRPQAMMADVWRKSGTLRVVRRDPYVTGAAKTPAVHVLGDREPPPTATGPTASAASSSRPPSTRPSQTPARATGPTDG